MQNKNDRRVVVTGMGAVTPIGHDVPTYWSNLVAGVSGIRRISTFPTDDLAFKVGGEVLDFNPSEHGLDAHFVRKQDRFTVFAVAAANEAIAQSGLDSSEGGNIDPFRFGVYVGSGIGGYSSIYKECIKMHEEGPKWISPTFVSIMIGNMAGGNIAIRHKACGPCLAVVAACATSTHAIGEAFRAIRTGYADAIVAGGSEASLIPMSLAAFGNSKALTKSEDPEYASLPFNANRAGFVFSEGAGVLVLEEYEHAKARGAEIFAEICGYGNTCDAYHVTAPNPTGETQAMSIRIALEEAGYTPEDRVHINAHGTGTILNDSSETKAIKLALGDADIRLISIPRNQ